MSTPRLPASKPLRYVIRCAGCGEEIEICPSELNERIAVCPACEMPNPTPIFGLLRGQDE